MAHVRVIAALEDNYIFLVQEGFRGIVVDPGDASPVLEIVEAEGIKLDFVLNTHHHADHVAGNRDLKRETGAEILGPDASRIPCLDRVVENGDRRNFGLSEIRVIATPGHTSNSVSYYIPPLRPDGAGVLFSGDTLFLGGCGRLVECGPEAMWASLQRLALLPERTLIYCGHEYTVENYAFALSIEPENEVVGARLAEAAMRRQAGRETVPSEMGQEKASNPFLRSATKEMRSALNRTGAEAFEIFAELRRRKDAY